jgi:YQGE family putative transporter
LELFFSYIYKFLDKFLGVRKHLPNNAKTLIWMIALYDFTFALSSVFINVFLFRQHQDWNVVLPFNIIQFVFVPVGFWVGGALSPRFGHRISYQLGFFFYSLLLLTVLILREAAAEYAIALGVLSGLAIGFYYLGQHALTMDLTLPKDRDYFFSLYLLLSSIMKIPAPMLAGWVIASFNTGLGSLNGSLAGYYLIFGFTLLIYIGLIFQSFRLKVPHIIAGFNVRKVMGYEWGRDWKGLLTAWFFSGIRGGVFWFVMSLFVYKVWNNELAVGNFNTLSTFLAVVTAYVLSRWEGYQKRKAGMAWSSLLIILSTLILAMSMGALTLLVFAILYSIGATWYQIGFGAISFNVIEHERDSKQRKLEYFTIRELPLALGRLLGLALFWFGLYRFGDIGLRVALVVLGLSQWGAYWFSRGLAAEPLRARRRA